LWWAGKSRASYQQREEDGGCWYRSSAKFCTTAKYAILRAVFSGMDRMSKGWMKTAGLMALLLAGVPAALAASAPPLSEVKVIKVQSASCGLEDITDGQVQTRCDHSAPGIKVYVLEIGYGQSQPQAALDGFEVNGTRSPVCAFDNGNLTECTPGSKTVGSLYTFDLAARQEGTFTFSNTSINAPRNTMSTQLYIK